LSAASDGNVRSVGHDPLENKLEGRGSAHTRCPWPHETD